MGSLITDIRTYISERIAIDGDCWVWQRHRNAAGYGTCMVRKERWLAHRLAYTEWKGDIPEGLVIDHLCRNRACCNPEHMEAVTQRENLRRGESFISQQMAMTHCIRGHEFDEANIYIVPSSGKRSCRKCRNDPNRLPVDRMK